MINKNQYRIANNKKLLHKVGKHWVVVSAMALALIGMSYSTVLTHTNVYASTLINSSASTKQSLAGLSSNKNQNMYNYTPTKNSMKLGAVSGASNSSNTTSNGRIESNNGSKVSSSSSINNQASNMHNQLVKHATESNVTSSSSNNGNGNNMMSHTLDAVPHFDVGAKRKKAKRATDTFTYVNPQGHSVGHKSFRGKTKKSDSGALTFISDLTNSDKTPGLNVGYYVDTSNTQVKNMLNILSDKVDNGKDHYGDLGNNKILAELKRGTVRVHFVAPSSSNNNSTIILNNRNYQNIGNEMLFPTTYGTNLNKYSPSLLANDEQALHASMYKGKTYNYLPVDYELVDKLEFIPNEFNNQDATKFNSNGQTNDVYIPVTLKSNSTKQTDYIHYVNQAGKVINSYRNQYGKVIDSVPLSDSTGNSSDFDTPAANFNQDLDNGKFDDLPGNYYVVNPEHITDPNYYLDYMNSRDNKYGNTHMNIYVKKKAQGTDYIRYIDTNTGNVINILNSTQWNKSDIDSRAKNFAHQVVNSNTFLGLPRGYHVINKQNYINKLSNTNDDYHYGSTALTIKIAKNFAPINITYIDANSGQQLSTAREAPINPSDPTSFGGPSASLETNGYTWSNIDDSESSNLGIKKFTYKPQSMTVAYNKFNNYNHPNNGKGDLDVFYFHNNSLAQYNDYGSFNNGAELKPDAFAKQGFNIVKGKDVNKINNGTQTIILTSNGNKTLQLPQVNDIIEPNAQDVFTYKTAQGKVIGSWKSSKGYSTQSDNDVYKAYIQSDYPDLPEQYKLANGEASKFSDFMGDKSNYDYGTNDYTFTVIPNVHTLTVNYVDNTNHQSIANNKTYQITTGDSVNVSQLASAVNPISNQKYDLNSAKLMDVNNKPATKFDSMPDSNSVLTIGYTPENTTLEHHNIITLNTFDQKKPVIVYSDEGVDQSAWNEFQRNIEKALKANKPYIFTVGNNEYEIPISNPSDLNSNFTGTTLNDVNKAMNVQNNTQTNPYSSSSKITNGTENKTLTQTKKATFTVQEINPINIYFMDDENGVMHHLTPKSVNDANVKDNAYSTDDEKVTVKGVDGGDLDVNGNQFTINDIAPKFIPKGFELNGNKDSDGFTTKPTDNITNFSAISTYNNGNPTFSSLPNNVYIAVKPIPVRAHTTITVNYLDADNNNNKIIPSTVTHGLEWQSFTHLISDETQALPNINSKYGIYNYVLNNVDYSGTDNNKSEYGKSDQVINLIYAKTKGRININYIDRTMGNTVHTTVDMGLIGSPFNNDESYLENVPSNYYFDGVSDNNVTHYSATDQNINVYMQPMKPAIAERTNITVNYIDKQSGKVIYNAGTISDTVGSPFDITPYIQKNSIPSDYHLVGVPDIQNYGDSNTNANIMITKNTPKPASSANSTTSGSASTGSKTSSASSSTSNNSSSSASSSSNNKQSQINGDIYLNYRDVDSGVIIKSEHFTEPVGTTFNLDGYVRNVPQGYKLQNLDHVSGATNGFYYYPQTIDIYITKLSNIPKQNQGIINISYVDAQTGKPLASNDLIKGDTNSAFNYSNNMKSFNHYTFAKNASKNLDINKFNNGTQYITLAYDKSQCKITIEFVNRDTGKVLKSVSTTANANTPFNASDYKNDVPTGYEIKGSNSIINMYDQQPQTFIYKVAQPNYHTITVNYIDGKTGKTILTKSATNDADTPFDIDDYISYIPRGYNWTKMPNNTVSKFDNNNHTYSIILSAIKPVQPSSTSAKPSSASVAPSSKASSASSSSAKSSASSASNSQSSASSKASSSTSTSSIKPSNSSKASSSATKSSSASSASTSTPFMPIVPSNLQPSSSSASNASQSSSAKSSVAPSSHKGKVSHHKNPIHKHVHKSRHMHMKHNHNKVIHKKHASTLKKSHSINHKVINSNIKHNPNKFAKYYFTNHQINMSNHHIHYVTPQIQRHISRKTVNTSNNSRKLPQTNESTSYALWIGIILLALSGILISFGKVTDRKHNE